MHRLALTVLKNHDSWEKGLGLTQAWKNAVELCKETGQKWPTKQGLSGRLSELQGLGLVRSERNKVRIVDYGAMQYRYEREPRWFLASRVPEEHAEWESRNPKQAPVKIESFV